MSVIRNSLSLIGFGFTIFQFFEKLKDAGTLASAHAARNSGITLVALGIGMLVLGIVYHVQFMVGLRHVRHEMTEGGLIHGESVFPPSLTLVTAVVLLMVGIGVIASMIFSIGHSVDKALGLHRIISLPSDIVAPAPPCAPLSAHRASGQRAPLRRVWQPSESNRARCRRAWRWPPSRSRPRGASPRRRWRRCRQGRLRPSRECAGNDAPSSSTSARRGCRIPGT
jgi:uncharacterized membrane protein YidH (DUF202 family)